MKDIALILAAVFCNVCAQFSMKFGANGSRIKLFGMETLSLWIIVAAALYGGSFFMTARILQQNSLSTVGPLMAGSTFVLVAFGGILFWSEPINLARAAGIALLFFGVLLVART
jgi:small multidrug resistance pump